MTQAWIDDVARYLADETICPRCGSRLTEPFWCATCQADLTGPEAARVQSTTRAAISALQLRQQYVAGLRTRERTEPATAQAEAAAGVSTAIAGAEATPSIAPAQPAPERSSVSLQSVLAVAGAALLAVAAIVFTFLNPDLTDFGTRTLIIGVVTVVFLGSAGMLVRTGLQFSAEAVGALGMVFVALDIWAFSSLAPSVSGWVFAGLGTVAGSAVLIGIASLARIRTWLWAGLVGVAISPAFFSYATGTALGAVIGHLGVGLFALVIPVLVIPRLVPRFGSALRVDRITAIVLEFAVLVVVLVQVLVAFPVTTSTILQYSMVLLVLAILAGASTRVGPPRLWSLLAGGLVVGAFADAAALFGVAPFDDVASTYLTAIIPSAAVIGLVLLALVPVPASVHRTILLIGGGSVALATATPAIFESLVHALLFGGLDYPSRSADASALSAILGVFAFAVGSAILSRLARRGGASPVLSRISLGIALWAAALALFALDAWSGFGLTTRAILGAALVLSLGAALTLIPPLRAAPLRITAPIITAAHLLLLSTAVLGWRDSGLTVGVGIAVVVLLALLARSMPAVLRPVYLGAAYAYALVVFAAGLSLVHVETIAVLCLTTTLASVTALISTLVRRVSARAWYAILLVTAVPFLIGIVSVLTVRSGWTALSTAVTFALALTLLLTTRPGLNTAVRTAAAALLVPSLSVVVICLGAQFLEVSGSPVTLPIIAVIVACVLPSTSLIASAIERRGLSERQVVFSRIAIEVSTLVTAVVAVALALGRSAAGLGTTFIVLLVIGIGAAVMAFFLRRRYGWALAFASWTGALWCVWALAGVSIAEPYILPPALIAAAIAAVLVGLGRPGIGVPALGLFAAGLTTAVLPSLAILAFVGDGPHARDSWRCIALLAASVILLAFGALARRTKPESRFARLGRLRVPLLIVATAAAAAGPVQAVRWGLGFDRVALSDSPLLMWPVLALSAASALLAVLAAGQLARRSGSAGEGHADPVAGRWITGRFSFMPAGVFLVAGPIAATRDGALPIFALYVLGLLLLAFMIAIVVVSRRREVTLPPVWFVFALAWCVMVASWSTREILRVEGYSLPLGIALLVAGVIAMRASRRSARPTITSWPVGFDGSWRLLAPGIVVTLLPSMLATGTDPQTWRAILVLALALAAILIGSLRRLAAPFVLGLAVLPLENIVVFAVQLGRSIGATPWWITLASAGAVLLVIAVTSERRSTGEKGVAARLRDLR